MSQSNTAARGPRTLNARRVGRAGYGPTTSVYVGRPSPWGNPFVIGPDGDRDRVIARYREYLLASPALLARLGELRGKDLICWCSPQACHADVLIELANATETTEAAENTETTPPQG